MNIVYLGGFRFPDKDAAAKRVLGIGMILNELGHQVVFAGGENGETSKRIYKGFNYYSQNELDKKPNRSWYNKLFDFFRNGNNTIVWLKSYIIENKVDLVIIYNGSFIFQTKILKFCEKNRIKIAADCTEWYDSSHLPGGKFGIVSIDNYLKMKWGYFRINNLILISSLLSREFRADNSVIIPPINTMKVIEERLQSDIILNERNDKTIKTIIYAGSPGKKDDLCKIIQIISEPPFFDNLIFSIIGIGEVDFCNKYPLVSIPKNVQFYGRVNHVDVIGFYKKADFSIIIRPNKRYANAGFPTKFVESLEFGIPVISTDTSDLNLYLKDSINGFILKDDKNISIRDVFNKIIELDNIKINSMKKNALSSSKNFDGINFKKLLDNFLNKLN